MLMLFYVLFTVLKAEAQQSFALMRRKDSSIACLELMNEACFSLNEGLQDKTQRYSDWTQTLNVNSLEQPSYQCCLDLPSDHNVEKGDYGEKIQHHCGIKITFSAVLPFQ
ncbi:Hypothetical predicted protein [Octopus vulgaris]|uniref:Uncharacterized protein n=1 Tax=Octopus vulgaris TaxID=6645 RepID=A0AA36F9D6_OCTVU|nr:Hypothetical predicted protein [Octopus vulgaris]